MTADDLAHRLDRRSYFHDPFRLYPGEIWLWRPFRLPLPVADERTRGLRRQRRTTAEDWRTEFLDYILALRVVDSPNDAIAHVGQFGSHHSDCIVTRNAETAERFLREVDSATVYWNASTRFTDGSAFGFGAEIGISTDKLHARGPMGLEELTTYKSVIRGDGQVRT